MARMAAGSGANRISERLRERKQAISDKWETAVRQEMPQLRPLDSHALCDHLPELLESLARWVEAIPTRRRASTRSPRVTRCSDSGTASI
jgi:hypothetical protein